MSFLTYSSRIFLYFRAVLGGECPDLRLSIRSLVKQLSTECPVAAQKLHFKLLSDYLAVDHFIVDCFVAALDDDDVVRSNDWCC
jgi:hypothetical protein